MLSPLNSATGEQGHAGSSHGGVARLTESQWKRLLPHIQRLKKHRREAAYNHLVRGMSLAQAGQSHGMSRQNVFHVTKTIEKYLGRLQASEAQSGAAVPKGWVRLEVVVPRRLVATTRRLVSALVQNGNATREKDPPKAPARRR